MKIRIISRKSELAKARENAACLCELSSREPLNTRLSELLREAIADEIRISHQPRFWIEKVTTR